MDQFDPHKVTAAAPVITVYSSLKFMPKVFMRFPRKSQPQSLLRETFCWPAPLLRNRLHSQYRGCRLTRLDPLLWATYLSCFLSLHVHCWAGSKEKETSQNYKKFGSFYKHQARWTEWAFGGSSVVFLELCHPGQEERHLSKQRISICTRYDSNIFPGNAI